MSKINHPEQQDRIITHDDEKKRILDLYGMRLVPPEGIDIFDEPTRCYRINKRWVPIVMGMVMQLLEVAPWRDAQHEGYTGIEQVARFLVGEECDLFELRQKPTDSCVLQQSLDGGETWIDVFDVSACVTIQDKTYQVQIQNQVTYVQPTFQEIYNNYTTNYAGNPESVYPDLADPAGDDSALRAAYCNAIWELVRVSCDTAVSYYTETVNQQQNEINVYLGVAAFILAAISLAAAVPTGGASLAGLAPSAALWAAGISLGAVFGNALVDFWQQHTIDQFQDTAAMEDVTCYLFEEVLAADNSLAAMQAALNSHPLTDNAAVIADFLAILLSHDSTYAAFLEKWNNNKEFADAGIELYCPCIDETYRNWIWDFANGLGEFTLIEGTLTGGRIRGVDVGDRKRIRLTMPFTNTWRARGGKLYYERLNGIAHGMTDYDRLVFRATPGTDVGAIAAMPAGGFLPNGNLERCLHFSVSPFYATGVNELFVDLGVTDSATADIYLDKVQIQFVADFAKGGYITDDGNMCA